MHRFAPRRGVLSLILPALGALLIVAPANAAGAVSYDASAQFSATPSNGANPYVWSHTIGPNVTDGELVVFAYNWDSTAAPTSVTYGSETMTLIDQATNALNGLGLFVYALPTGTTIGTQNVSVNWGTTRSGFAFSESVSGADQNVADLTSTASDASSFPASVSLADPANGLVVNGLGGYSGAGGVSIPTSPAGAPDQTFADSLRGVYGGLRHTTAASVTWNSSGLVPHTMDTVSIGIPPATSGGSSGGGGSGGSWGPVPYASNSPWNTPISSNPTVDPSSASYIQSLTPGQFTSDPTQYAVAIFHSNSSTPLVPVTYNGWWSDAENGDASLTNTRCGSSCNPQGGLVNLPVPPNVQAGAGSDGNVVVINDSDGSEYDFHQFDRDANGNPNVTNVGHYSLTWSGVPVFTNGCRATPGSTCTGNPYILNGDGTPYLAGMIRPFEIQQGHIDHALALAIQCPSSSFVYPAVKSDGRNSTTCGGTDIPEGSRVQLDPSLTDAQIQALGCTGTCLVIAHALQTYGAYVENDSGRNKLTVEDSSTANWGTLLTSNTVTPLTPSNGAGGFDWSRFRVVDNN